MIEVAHMGSGKYGCGPIGRGFIHAIGERLVVKVRQRIGGGVREGQSYTIDADGRRSRM